MSQTSLPCPNNCKMGSVPREDMKAHKQWCVIKMTHCEYYNIGCKARIPCTDEEKHRKEKMEEHLMMMKLKLSETEDALTSTQDRLTSSEERLSKLETIVHQAINRTGTIGHDDLMTSLRWMVNVTTMATMAWSGIQICPVVIKMSQYARRKETNIQWLSQTFFTHSEGYRLCMYVNAAGTDNGKGTHMSVHLFLTKGPHDDKLAWPLRGNFIITLLNQISHKDHHSFVPLLNDKSTAAAGNRVMNGEYAAKGWGTTTFISNEKLYTSTPVCQFLKDDCIFFQVMVYK